MKPGVPAVLEAIAELLDVQSDPQARTAYDADALLRAASLLRAVAAGFDGAVAWRVQELQAWRSLFAEAAPAVDDRRLSAALAEAAASATAATGVTIEAAPADALRVSVLDARLDTLRALADELLAWSEAAGTPVAEAIGRAVWDGLREGTVRRQVAGSRF